MITELAEWLRGRERVQHGDAARRDGSRPGGVERDDMRFHLATRNGMQF